MQTVLPSVNVELGDFNFGPDAGDILTQESKPNVFKTDDPLKAFDLNNIKEETTEVPVVTKQEEIPGKLPIVNVENVLEQELEKFKQEDDTETTEGQGTEEEKVAGRPKVDKNPLSELLINKFTDKSFEVVFDDKDDNETVEQYINRLPAKDLQALLDKNIQAREDKLMETASQDIFESLSPELQYAYQYELNGGQDRKALFAALAQVEEVRAMDPADETDQILISRNYLQATKWGTPEEIQNQIEEWKEDGKIAAKATQFKPKLDQMQEEQVKFKIQQQDEFNRRQAESAQMYINSVREALKPGDLMGAKPDKKTLANIEYGLTNLAYQSASGQPTNILGHLLDKIQYMEPNFPLLAKATWLLMDPEGYDNAIAQKGKNEQVEKVTKLLKDGQHKTGVSTQMQMEEPAIKKIPKARNVLQRN